MTNQQNTATVGDVRGIPGRPARSEQQRPECRHWVGAEQRHCREPGGVRLYIPGLRCPAHTPNALQGKTETPPGPGWPIHREEQCS